jgi:alpha-L-fucosidase
LTNRSSSIYNVKNGHNAIERGLFMPNIILPTEEHIIWSDLEVGVLLHMDVQVFRPEYKFREQWGYQPPAEVFAPMELNTDQWIRSAKAGGAKYAILVAKHCSGFCLWPTEAHDYSIKKSPWKNGSGDIVGDFFASCKKYGLKPGLYYSSSCNAYLNVDNPGIVQTAVNVQEEQRKYNEIVIQQLTELWTRYGEVFEIWFDGGCLPVENGGPDIVSLLRTLQPNALVFQGPPGIKALLRWVGNERGIAPEDCFATVDFTPESFDGHDERIYGGNPYGLTWSPAESDIPNRYADMSFEGGWFWHEGEEHALIPADALFDVYLKSVGRNTNMLIGMVIDNRGLVPAADAAIFAEFNAKIEEAFGTPIAALSQSALKGAPDKYNYRLKLPSGSEPKYLVMAEDIAQGERVLNYTVNGNISGKCISHKRIIELPPNTKEIVLNITEAKDEPLIKTIAVF